MIHSNNPVIKHKAGLLNLAEELNNVSRACKVMGVSRDTFYRYKELVEEGGIDALLDKSRRVPNLKNRTTWTPPCRANAFNNNLKVGQQHYIRLFIGICVCHSQDKFRFEFDLIR